MSDYPHVRIAKAIIQQIHSEWMILLTSSRVHVRKLLAISILKVTLLAKNLWMLLEMIISICFNNLNVYFILK